MNLKLIGILFKKEILKFSRDKRAIGTFFSMVLGMPLLYLALLGVTLNKAQENAKKDLELEVVKGGNSEDLLNYLETMEVKITPTKSFDYKKFQKSTKKLALIIPESFDLSTHTIHSDDNNRLTLYVNENEKSAGNMSWRLEKLLNAYSGTVGMRRLYMRGINPELVSPIKVKTIKIDAENPLSAMFLQMLGTILVIACFMSTIYLSVDIIAGEKSRNSLEPLLVTPHGRLTYLLPKFLHIFLLVVVAIILATALFMILIKQAFFQNFIVQKVDISYGLSLAAICLYIPLGFLGASMQVFFSTIAKSVKEAQAYLSFLSLATLIPSVLAGQLFEKNEGILAYTPSVSQGLIIEKLLVGNIVTASEVLKSASMSIALALIFIYLTFLAFKSEKIFDKTT